MAVSPGVSVSIVAGRPQLSIGELYQKFVTYYGASVPWKPQQVLERHQNHRARAGLSRRVRLIRSDIRTIANSNVKKVFRDTVLNDSTEYRHVIEQSDVTRPPPYALRHRVDEANVVGVPHGDVTRRSLRVVGRKNMSDRNVPHQPGRDDAFDNSLPMTIRRCQWPPPEYVDDVMPMTSLTGDKCSDASVDVIARPVKYGHRVTPRRTVMLRNCSRQPHLCFIDADTCANSIPEVTSGDVESRVTRTTFKPTSMNGRKANSRNQLPSLDTTRSLQNGENPYLEDKKQGTARGCQQAGYKDHQPGYKDPIVDSPETFLQRINDIVTMELKTIRWEKTRRLKKKRSRDSL